MRLSQLYDVAATILQQKLSQLKGVGQVTIVGGSAPAVRIDVNPTLLNNFGISLEQVRGYIGTANANRPKGELWNGSRTWSLATDDQLMKASEYRPLVIAYNRGGPVKLSDVATITDSTEDLRQAGFVNGKPALVILVSVSGANIVETCDRIKATLPQLRDSIPPPIRLDVLLDTTTATRASVHDGQVTTGISIVLVITVVFVFLRSGRTTLIPAVAVPISLHGTFGVLYLFGYSVDNLSMMALTIATGFVVDDAIVVIENITRYVEQGMAPVQAALRGAQEIGFTVLSISISLIAVFIPILLMGGFVGRLFREFAVTLSVAILISLLVSLTLTPMMCARLLRTPGEEQHGILYRVSERGFNLVLRVYGRSLQWVLRHQPLTFSVTLATIVVTVYLYIAIPKGFFPQTDVGTITGQIQADQASSFQAMRARVLLAANTVAQDPAVENVIAFMGGGGALNSGRMFITLRPPKERKLTADQVIGRLRPRLARVPGTNLFLQAIQVLRIGTRIVGAQYQYTLQSESVSELNQWAPLVYNKLRTLRQLTDVNTNQQDKGLQSTLVIDRNTASRFGITSAMIDDTLYDAFGQRQVSTLYTELNQYHVVMEADPLFWQNPDGLKYLYVTASNGRQVPLSAFTRYEPGTAALSVNHQGQFPSATISFNLPPGIALGDAVPVIEEMERQMGMPSSIHGSFAGTAQAYQESLASEPILIAGALITVYIVAGDSLQA